MIFTDDIIDRLEPKKSKYYKREKNGFALRVMPSGNKTWLFIYTISGRRNELKLGEFPFINTDTARKRYKDARLVYKQDKDPKEHFYDWDKRFNDFRSDVKPNLINSKKDLIDLNGVKYIKYETYLDRMTVVVEKLAILKSTKTLKPLLLRKICHVKGLSGISFVEMTFDGNDLNGNYEDLEPGRKITISY